MTNTTTDANRVHVKLQDDECLTYVASQPYKPGSTSHRSRAECECGWVEQQWHRDRNGFGLQEAKEAAEDHHCDCPEAPDPDTPDGGAR